jgi:hypothetical protein
MDFLYSEIAGQVQEQGIISYRHGRMTIVDRDRLEDLTCECYALIRAEFERLLGRPEGTPRLKTRARVPRLSEGGRSTSRDGTPRRSHEEAAMRSRNP